MVKAMIRLVLVNVLKFVFAFTVGQLKGSGHNLHKKFAKIFFKIVADSKYNFSLSIRLYSQKKKNHISFKDTFQTTISSQLGFRNSKYKNISRSSFQTHTI